MTNLTAESALETALKLILEEEAVGPELNHKRIARAIIQTRIEAMQDCARNSCSFCEGHTAALVNGDGIWHAVFGENWRCAAQFEQREIARLAAELEQLK